MLFKFEIPPDDYRILQENSQIWTIKLTDVIHLSNILPDHPVDQERMSYVYINIYIFKKKKKK